MYFPTSAARQLSSVPALPNIPSEPVLGLCPGPRKSLFCLLTRNGVAVWRIRPPAVLAYLSRTPTSIIDHGENANVHWSPDGSRIVIQTSESYLVLINVEYKPNQTSYQAPLLPTHAQRNFLSGPGESLPLHAISLHFEGVVRIEGSLLSVSPRRHHLLFSTKNPPAIQRIPWPTDAEGGTRRDNFHEYDTWIINEGDFPWFIDGDVSITQILYSRAMGIETWITSDGRVYFVRLHENIDPGTSISGLAKAEGPQDDGEAHHRGINSFRSASDSQGRLGWRGTCVHNFKTPRWVQKQRRIDPDEHPHERDRVYEEPQRAVAIAINGKFSLIAVGTFSGGIEFTNFPSEEGITPKSQTIQIPNPYNRQTGEVCTLEWSSDGYVLAVGWKHGWGIFSVGGRCLASGLGVDDLVDEERFQDAFMYGVRDLFWAQGNFELVVLAQASPQRTGQLFVIPFAKSATTGQHSPDNTRYAFLQMDDRALVYRGADQPDMSVINPESDVWQHIKIPQSYLAMNWPIRYSSLSNDGRLIAIAGRRGLIHYSSTSGRWKVFGEEEQEQAFTVKGGLVWFHHVLIAAVEVSKSYQIRLYSRDLELTSQNALHREVIPSAVVILSLVDNSLLVYTADNTLYHYLIVPTPETIKLHLCGSITFTGIIVAPGAVRMLSWMIPSAQKHDLSVATVLMVVGGQLILLRPRKSATDQEVKYDMQIFADRIEFCWTHLRGIGTLENSLWGYDGQGIRVWLNALAIESPQPSDTYIDVPGNVKESVNIPLDFYPLSVLMDKGIIIGAEHEAATRSNLTFVMFRHATSSHLFLHHILLFLLGARQIKEAVIFASHYKELVFFAHALEILLHTVVESEAALECDTESDDEKTSSDTVLPTVVQFLDHFEAALDVVVGCARKTELTRWRRLFNVVGNPKSLFETCLTSQRLKTAGSYLLVLHNLEQLDEDSDDAVRLLKSAVEGKDWQLCRELLRFLHSIDDTGAALRNALTKTRVIEFLPEPEVPLNRES
ncbi:RIC1-domain-containing protein [Collybia nuda]|uniref:RIC1-domain-containing protein n=1 Tax=Collybia nuda TaxID=64659 RepID=A0A9P6CAU1_9AGAR|nr:RIC1-domain-containing protein [Collybia nuda]